MRVKFGNPKSNWNHVMLCTNVSWGGDRLLNITTMNGVYVVDCKTAAIAEGLYNMLFRYGYIDVSEYDYSN